MNGETHRYLGRQYRLRLLESASRSVRLAGGYFLVSLPEPQDREAVRRLMETWYRGRARAVIQCRMERVLKATTWLGLEGCPAFSIKVLTHRWGSTTKGGRITFNVDAIKLPVACLDYVIAHELAHIRIPNHSLAYWRMLGRVMPDWERWRDKLAMTEL